MNLIGLFELHNTIKIDSDPNSNININNYKSKLELFYKVCEENKLKPINISVLYNKNYKLPNYKNLTNNISINNSQYYPVEFYQTSYYFKGNYLDAEKKLFEISNLLKSHGFEIDREKIEVVKSTIDTNLLTQLDFSCYYEYHIVIECTDYNESIFQLENLNNQINNTSIKKKYVPLSINLKNYNNNNLKKIFITARNYLSDVHNINIDIDKLYESFLNLIKEKFNVVKTINEIVLFDSNEKVDCQDVE